MFKYLFLFQPDVDMDASSQSFLDVILASGFLGIGIVLILILLSIYALYIFIERYLTIQKAGEVDENFMNNIRSSISNGNIEAAKQLCKKTDTPAARMIEKGILRIGKPMRDINVAIENVGNLEVNRLEKNISRLATIAGAAPMIGFFGTVTGMISAFYEMATQQSVTPSLLAGGIYQALLTTAFGLFVGIIAFVGYNILVSSVEKVIFKMEFASMEFMDLLQEPTA